MNNILNASYQCRPKSILKVFSLFQNAINIFTKDGIDEFLKENRPTSSKHVLIFHCEFSSKRGPKLCRFLRSRDREMNKDSYPVLNFPEIYLLEGGYKQFYESHTDLCFPQAYKPMLDRRHSADLRHFRVKSKSWAAGDKPRYERTGLQRLKLSFNWDNVRTEIWKAFLWYLLCLLKVLLCMFGLYVPFLFLNI